MKVYKEHNRFGPGGARCRCCNPFERGSHGIKKTKRRVNRIYRRAAKQNIEKE